MVFLNKTYKTYGTYRTYKSYRTYQTNKAMLIHELKDKTIAIVGFAREGQDTLLALQKLLPKKEIEKNGIGVFDANQDSFKRCPFKGQKVKGYSGENYLKELKNYQVVIKTPGIPLAKIKPFLGRGAIMTSQTEVFFDNFKGLCVGVTGTKGKGTTATLIYQILKEAGFKVKLVGNIGKPVLGEFLKTLYPQGAKILIQQNDLLGSAPPQNDGRGNTQNDRSSEEVFVYELSSYQVEGLKRIKKSPQIAVFLNLFPDHLDYYKNFKAYKKAKEPIFSFQGKNDFFIYNAEDKTAREFARKSQAKKISFNRIPLKVKTKLKGDFNLLNIKAAFVVGRLLGVGENTMKKTIANFKGLEHRLEYVGKFKGIDFYNDSMSTLPEVAVKAIEAVRPQTLIAGGSCKGSDYKEMAKAIIKYKVKNLVLLEKQKEILIQQNDPVGSPLNNKSTIVSLLLKRDSSPSAQNDIHCRHPEGGTTEGSLKRDSSVETGELLLTSLKGFKGKVFRTSKMKEAVEIAFRETKRGGACLLSPGAASFNLFKDYAHRGGEFKRSVKVAK
ncbi:MAG: Mur ligase family protein [bacterium]|nr:Mur ligase family protein [bacterium]